MASTRGRLRGVMGLLVMGLCGVPAARAGRQGESYIEAYNVLVGMVKARCEVVDLTHDEMGFKDPQRDSLTFSEFDKLRGKVIALKQRFIVPPPHTTGPWTIDEAGKWRAFPTLHESEGSVFLMVPAAFTTDKLPITTHGFSGDLGTFPLLWEHFEEVHAILKRMRYSRRAAAWVPGDAANARQVPATWGQPWHSAQSRAAAAFETAPLTVLANHPRLLTWGQRKVNYYDENNDTYWARAVASGAHVAIGGVAEAAHRIQFYGFVRRAQDHGAVLTGAWDAYGHDGYQEGFWRLCGVGAADAAGAARSDWVGPVAEDWTQFETWCGAPPDPRPHGKQYAYSIRGFQVEVPTVIMEWLALDETSITRPPMRDPSEDGVVFAGCACPDGCEPHADPGWRDMEANPICRLPLGISSGHAVGGIRVQAYVVERYGLNGTQTRLNLDTYARACKASNGKWEFVTVRRPSGAEVVFAMKGDRPGQPIEGGGAYRMSYRENAYELNFPGKEPVVHRFGGQGFSPLSTAARELSEVRLTRANREAKAKRVMRFDKDYVRAEWTDLHVYRSPDAARRLTAVSSPSYPEVIATQEAGGRLVLAYRDAARVEQTRVTMDPGSRWYRTWNAAGELRDQVRVVASAEGTTIERYGALETPVLTETTRVEAAPAGDGGRLFRREVTLHPGAPDADRYAETIETAMFPWGEEPVGETLGPDDPSPLVTRYAYYTDPADAANYGRLRLIERPDGGWTRYVYDDAGRVIVEVHPFGDAAPDAPEAHCRVIRHGYAQDPLLPGLGFPADDVAAVHDARPRLTVETVRGHEVARTYHAFLADRTVTRQTRVPGAAYDDPTNLTEAWRAVATGVFAGRLESVQHANGLVTRYLYQHNTAQNLLTVTMDNGEGSVTLVTNGTRTVTVSDGAGRRRSRRRVDIASGLLLEDAEWWHDGYGRATGEVERVSGRTAARRHGCCGVEWERDADGAESVTEYTPLRQVQAVIRDHVATLFQYNAGGRTVHRWRTAGGEVEPGERQVYDGAGRLVAVIDAAGGRHVHTEGRTLEGGVVRRAQAPDGSVVVERSFRDGSPRDVSGSAAVPRAYAYGAAPGETWVTEYQGADTNAAAWVRTVTDMLGHTVSREYPDGYRVETAHDADGREIRRTDGMTTQLWEHDRLGQFARSVVDMDGDGVASLAGPDRIEESRSWVAGFEGRPARGSETRVYPEAGSAVAMTLALQVQALNGRESWSIVNGRTGRVTVVRDPDLRRRVDTQVEPDGSRRVGIHSNGQSVVNEWWDADDGLVASERYGYDDWGRLVLTTRADVNGAAHHTRLAYDALGRVTARTEIAHGADGVPRERETQWRYDAEGRLASEVGPDGVETTYHYDRRGALLERRGAREYPVRRAYDDQGRLETLTTFRGEPANGAAPPQGDVTRWEYDPLRGWLSAKHYADGTVVRYTYRADGTLAARVWARGVETRYAYDAAGGLTNIVYSDGTPEVRQARDRRGRVVAASDGVGAHAWAFDPDGELRAVDMPGLPGAGIDFDTDGLGRLTNLVLRVAEGPLLALGHGYDAAGRLTAMTADGWRARWAYGADGRTITNLAVAGAMRVDRRFDGWGRLVSQATRGESGEVWNLSAYDFDASDRRVRQTLADGAYWGYEYDARGQLVGAGMRNAAGDIWGGRDFEYAYDAIGNRTRSAVRRGVRTQTATYVANALNQYVERTVPGEVWVTGDAAAEALVLIKRDEAAPPRSAVRQGDYFHLALAVSNAASPVVLTNIQVIARWIEGEGEEAASVYQTERREARRPASPERFAHDPDGNLVGDGLWQYTWDAENRLVAMETAPSMPPEAWQRLEFAYDFQNRRTVKRVYDARTGADGPPVETRFLWHGWTLLGEIISGGDRPVTNLYIWGPDLSDTLEGAGGIGGLIATLAHPSRDAQFYAHDGSGNVMALHTPTGTETARYTHTPFGEPLQATGPQANNNPWRFSARYTDAETGLVMYPLRAYSVTLGRWLSRDPIKEAGGINLYALVHNAPLNAVDALGLALYAFDGTANVPKNGTNVRLTYESGWQTPNAHYERGIGNEEEHTLIVDQGIRKATGLGLSARRSKVLREMEQFLKAGDTDVEVIGFSRGAVTAITFAEVVQELKRKDVYPFCLVDRIRFMGLYDPVPGPFIRHRPGIPGIVQRTAIAYSLDEKRYQFAQSMYSGGGVTALGFRGGHSDVGGGYDDRGLANISLEWMIDQGRMAGAPFKYPTTTKGSKMHRHQEINYNLFLYADRIGLAGVTPHSSVARLVTGPIDRVERTPQFGVDVTPYTYYLEYIAPGNDEYRIGDRKF